MRGKLYGVGVGPGDPELMTLKAIRILRECDVAAIPGLAAESCTAYQIAVRAFPDLRQKELLPVDMPMSKKPEQLRISHEKGAEQIMYLLKQNKTVAFLTLGDPTVYSTYLYLHSIIKAHGFEAAIINGIPSFCAAAAALGVGLTEGSEALHVYPASYPMEELFQQAGTKVLMKSGKSYSKVKEQLQSSAHQCSMVVNCGMENEKVYDSIEEFPDESSYFSLIIAKEEESSSKQPMPYLIPPP